MILEKAVTPAQSQYVSLYTSTSPFAFVSLPGDHGHTTGQCGGLAETTTHLQSRFRVTGNMGFTQWSIFGCAATKGHMITRMANTG